MRKRLKLLIDLRTLFTFETAGIGNQAAKVKTTMLVSMSDLMIISFQKKLNIKWDMINALCNPY